jgi:hypothetical protein
MLDVQVPVSCPICGADTRIIDQEVEPGYELEPFWDVLAGVPVLATEYVSPRVAAWNLQCGCRVATALWVLRFEAPGVRPYFIKKE